MSAYLTTDQFKLRTVMPSASLDELESYQVGWLAAQLEMTSRYIDARLRKRYAVPFVAPVPEMVAFWLTMIVTRSAYLRLGVKPTDSEMASIFDAATSAESDLKEAADSDKGLFDLPLVDGAQGSAIVKSGPLGYSEASPYVSFDIQRQAGRAQDSSRGGNTP